LAAKGIRPASGKLSIIIISALYQPYE